MKGLDQSRPLSLYIHVPFCTRKCDYCAFYSIPLSAAEPGWIDRYVSMILAEIGALSEEWGKPFHTIFIGGGNPGILGYANLRRILEKAEENGMPEEVTVEINPENITPELQGLSDVLTRVSVGIQSMDDEVLRRLGRNASRADNIRALELLSSMPFRWNADIITAVPGESIGRTLKDIEEVASYSPGHISFYCLAFEEGTPLIARETPVGEEAEAEFLEKGWQRLRELGYEHYEVSNFAKSGERCLHNLVYWNLGQYIGFGPGSEGSVGYSTVTSMRDTPEIGRFLSSPELECTPLSSAETEEEFLLVSLRTSDGIRKSGYRERFGRDFDSVYGGQIASIPDGCFTDSPEAFALTEKGFMMLDWIILHLAMGM